VDDVVKWIEARGSEQEENNQRSRWINTLIDGSGDDTVTTTNASSRDTPYYD
jgi:hypothetical protein